VSRRERTRARLRRYSEFWDEYRRNKLGTLGIALIVMFSVLAVGAPLITPYDPLKSTNLAGSKAAPVWMTAFPGYRQASRNIDPIRDPSFSTVDSFKQWQTSTSSPAASVEYAADIGNPEDGKPGSMMFQFSRPAGIAYGKVAEQALVSFASNYEAPQRFTLDLNWRADISENEPVRVSAVIQDPNGSQYVIWEETMEDTGGEWEKPTPRIDSWSPQLRLRLTQDILGSAERTVFSTPGTYSLVLRVSVSDDDPNTAASVRLYFDDVEFRGYGSVFGYLGTDEFGADLFSQLIYGARLSLIIGILASLLSVTIGTMLGLAAGYLGGPTDEVVMRFNDMLLVLPGLPLLLVLVAVLGPSIWNLVILIGLLGFMSTARVIRSQALSYRERTFIEAARAAGAGSSRIMFKHLLPNVMSLAFAQLALSVPTAIVTEAALSWLGLGDPTVPTWGRMLYLAHYYGVLKEWWWIVFPGLCIALVSVSFIFVGHAMDEILNPRLRRR